MLSCMASVILHSRLVSDKRVAVIFFCAMTRIAPLKILPIRLDVLSCLLVSTLLSEYKLFLRKKLGLARLFVGVISK